MWDDPPHKDFHAAWNAGISFDIFELKDSVKAYESSESLISFSPCHGSELGGDIIFVGKYIFVNSDPCVLCYRPLTKKEYCRPTINFIFSNSRITNLLNLQEIIDQIPIRESKRN